MYLPFNENNLEIRLLLFFSKLRLRKGQAAAERRRQHRRKKITKSSTISPTIAPNLPLPKKGEDILLFISSYEKKFKEGRKKKKNFYIFGVDSLSFTIFPLSGHVIATGIRKNEDIPKVLRLFFRIIRFNRGRLC